MAGLVSFISVVASAWTFESAPLSAVPATGRETAPEVFEMRVPDRGGCGWRTTTAAVRPRGGVRFRATAEIALDEARDFVHNDFMMFVRREFPKDGKDRSKSGNGLDKGEFCQRDFIAYADRVVGGKVIRTFDETYAAPGESDAVEIEFIGKWHAMTVTIRDVCVENVERPKPRVVRCVVGNPFESTGRRIIAARRRAGEEKTGVKATYQNHSSWGPSVFGGLVWDVYECVRDLDPAYVGLEYDPMHAFFETNLSWTHGLELVAPWISSVDLKDFHFRPDPKNSKKTKKAMVAAGDGIVPWREVKRLLGKSGVDPLYIVHFEYDFGKTDLRKTVKCELDAFRRLLA